MIITVSGHEGGLKDYLEHGQKQGRDLHRDSLDQRIPLFGDLGVFDLATTGKGEGKNYDTITLSFDEHHVPDEILATAVAKFRDHALSAWPESERYRIAFYAEAHRPRITSYIDKQTGETIDRLTHIHIAVGKRDLLTNKAIQPLGWLGKGSDNLKYIDAWQESFNSRHGFSSPKDHPKITPENAVDILARYTGEKPDPLGTFNSKKSDLEIVLQKEILARDITTWEGFRALLNEHGEVTKMYAGQFNECYRILPNGSGRAMRLKGVYFQRQFIERPTSEKIAIISKQARVAYLEQMQPKKETAYVTSILNEWRTVAAREFRFIHKSSPFYKKQYKPADAATRLQLLDELERNQYAKSRAFTDKPRKLASTRGRLPDMPISNLDEILQRSEMLLQSHDGVHVPVRSGVSQNSQRLRSTNEIGAGARIEIDRPISPGRKDTPRRSKQKIMVQPSSMVERFDTELRERFEQANDKDRYSEIKKNLDCGQLLNRLSHSHGVKPSLYTVTTASDGSPRIKCGSRSLSPSDFLTKELGLAWKDAAPILRDTYSLQIGRKVIPPARTINKDLWKSFKADQDLKKSTIRVLQDELKANAKKRRTSLAETLKEERKAELSGLHGGKRKAKYSIAKMKAAATKAELAIQLKRERDSFRDRHFPANAYQIFLLPLAEKGDIAALSELRRLNEVNRAREAVSNQPAISASIIIKREEEEKRAREAIYKLRSLSHKISMDGVVTYFLAGIKIIKDDGDILHILDETNEQSLIAALMFARERFGMTLVLTGSTEFQQRCAAVAARNDIAVKFHNPDLESLHAKLVSEKRQVHIKTPLKPPTTIEQKSVLPSNNPAKRAQAKRAEVAAPISTPVTVNAELETARKELVQRFGATREAVPLDLLGAVVVGAVDGMAVLSVGRGIHVFHNLPQGSKLPAVGERFTKGGTGPEIGK